MDISPRRRAGIGGTGALSPSIDRSSQAASLARRQASLSQTVIDSAMKAHTTTTPYYRGSPALRSSPIPARAGFGSTAVSPILELAPLDLDAGGESVRRRITDDQHRRELQTLKARNEELLRQSEQQALLLDDVSHKYRRAEQKVQDLSETSTAKVLEGKISALNGIVAEKNVELAGVKTMYQDKTLRMEALEKERGSAGIRGETLERELGVRSNEAQRAKLELQQAQSRLSELESQLEAMSERASVSETTAHTQISNTQRTMAGLEEALQATRKECMRTKDEHQQAKEKNAELTIALNSLSGEASRLRADLSSTAVVTSQREREKDEAQSRSGELEARVEALRNDLTVERKVTEELTREAERLRAAKVAAEARQRDFDVVDKRRGHLEQKLEVLQECLNRNDADLQEETSRHKGTKRRVEELESKESAALAVKTQLHDTEQTCKDVQAAAAKLQNQVHALEERVDAEKAATKAAADRASLLGAELLQMQVSKEAVEAELAKESLESSRVHTLEGQVKGLEAMIETKEYEIRRLHEENIVQTDQLGQQRALATELAPLRGEVERLREELRVAEERIHKAELQKNEAQMQTEARNIEVTQLETLSQHHQNTVRDRDETINKITIELTKCEHEGRRADELQRQLDDVLTRAEELRTSETALAEQHAASRAECEATQRKVAELEAAGITQTARCDALLAELGDSSVQQEQLQTLNTQLRAEEERLNEVVTQLRTSNSSLTTQVGALSEAGTTHQAEARELRDSHHQSELRISDLDNACASMELELKLERERTQQLGQQVQSIPLLESDIAQLQGEVAEMTAAYSDKTHELATKTQEALNVRMRVKSLESAAIRSEELAHTNADLLNRITTAKRDVVEMEAVLEQKGQRVRELETALKSRTDEHNTMSEQMSKATEDVKELRERCTHLEIERERALTLQGKLSGMDETLKEKHNALDDAFEENTSLKSTIARLEATVADRAHDTSRLASAEDELSSTHDTLQRLQAEADKNRRVQSDLRDELEEVKGKKQRLEEEISTATAHSQGLQKQVTTISSDAESKARKARDDLKQLEDKVRRLTADYSDEVDKSKHAAAKVQFQGERIRELEEESKKRKSVVDRLEADKGRNAVEWNDLCDQLKEERDTSAGSYKVVATLRSENDELRGRVAHLSGSLHTLEQRLQSETRVKDQQIETAQSLLDELRLEMEKVIASRAIETERMQAERQTLQRTEHRFKQLEAQSSTTDHTVQELKQRLADAQKNTRSLERTAQDKEREALNSRADAAEAKKTLGILESTVQQMRAKIELQSATDLELRDCKQKLHRIESEVNVLREQNGVMNKELRGGRVSPAPFR